MHHQELRARSDLTDRGEVFQRVVGKLRIYHRVERHGAGIAQKDSVAVGRLPGGILGTDDARSAAPIVDDDRRAEKFAELRLNGAREEIKVAAGREWHHELDRAARVCLRDRNRGARNSGNEQKCANACPHGRSFHCTHR